MKGTSGLIRNCDLLFVFCKPPQITYVTPPFLRGGQPRLAVYLLENGHREKMDASLFQEFGAYDHGVGGVDSKV